MEVVDTMDQPRAREGRQGPREAGRPPIPVEVLRDRWEGLRVHVNRFDDGESDTMSELWADAFSALCALYEGVARQAAHDTHVDGRQSDAGGAIAAECLDLVGEHIIRRVHEGGLAR